jgi:hypothetical protein
VGVGWEVWVCGAAAVSTPRREVIEGAEEGTEGCASCGYETEAGFDGGPDCYVSVICISRSLLQGGNGGRVTLLRRGNHL